MLGLYVPPSVDPAIAAALENYAEQVVSLVASAYADHRTPAPTEEEPYPWAEPTPEDYEQAEADVTQSLQEFLRDLIGHSQPVIGQMTSAAMLAATSDTKAHAHRKVQPRRR